MPGAKSPPKEEVFLTPREQRSNMGFAVWYSHPRRMPDCHQHNDVEVNFLEEGSFLYLHGGALTPVRAGQIALFWASRPHQVIEVEGKPFFWGLSVPLGWVMNWRLPKDFVQRLLQGEMLFPPDDRTRDRFLRLAPRWVEDMRADSSPHRRVMLLEIEAWFQRMAQEPLEPAVTPPPSQATGGLEKVERMARYINEHYRRAIGVADVAKAVGLHPNYAVNLFRQKTGSTLVDFLMKQRLAHAQLLLATTEEKVQIISEEAGFGSASRFYAVFADVLGMSPREYRALLRNPRTQ